MASKTAWTAGQLTGSLSFTTAFNAADLNSLANVSCVLSSLTPFANSVGDQFMDISFVGALASSSSLVASAGISFNLAVLQEDGVTLGDGRLAPGTQTLLSTYQPLQLPLGGIPLPIGSGVTTIAGALTGLTIPPRTFALIITNATGFTFASSGITCSISTYRQNTNA